MNQQPTIVYAVFKEAVYRHGCGGIFTDPEDAQAAAELLRDGERDGHHNYIVVPFPLNEMTEQTPIEKSASSDYLRGGELVELPVLIDVGRKK